MSPLLIYYVAFLLSSNFAGVMSVEEESRTKINGTKYTETTKVSDITTTTSTPTKTLTAKQSLTRKLFKGYDKSVQPVKNHSHPIRVAFGLSIIHLDINEMKSTLDLFCWRRMIWKDEFMTWDPEDYDGIKFLHIDSQKLWKPDIELYNTADVTTIETEKTQALVYSDGTIKWVPPSHLKAFCKFDLRYWPVDKHECILKFASWTASGHVIDLELYNNVTEVALMNFYTDHTEWDILRATLSRGINTFDCCEEPYPYVNVRLQIQRDSPTYRSVIVLPCLILMLTTGCAFLLPPNNGEKLIVSGLSLIGNFMFLIYFANTLPFHQSSIPILVTFYSNTAGLIGIAILLNVMCLSMAREKKYNHPPKFLTRLFSGFAGKVLCLSNYTHQVSSTHQRLSVELSSIDNADDTYSNGGPPRGQHQETYAEREQSRMLAGDRNSIIMQDWLLVAAGIERFFFLTYAFAFAIVTSIYI